MVQDRPLQRASAARQRRDRPIPQGPRAGPDGNPNRVRDGLPMPLRHVRMPSAGRGKLPLPPLPL